MDELPRDPLSSEVLRELYGLDGPPEDETVARITDDWRPYRMWATVLLRVGWERSSPGRSYRRRPT